MKLVYVAGPFRAITPWKVEQNIRRAEELALEVWRAGLACICPHANARAGQGELEDKVWLEGDLEILSRCDAILMTPDWEPSAGAQAELLYAYDHGLAVFFNIEDLKAWADEPVVTH